MSNSDDWFKQYKTYEARFIELNKNQDDLAKKIRLLEQKIALEEYINK